MAVIVVDTDVYSYITSSDPRRGLPYKQHLDGHIIALSFITVGEQYAGYLKQISKGTWPAARLAKLEAGLRSVAIIPYDIQVCKTFGALKAKSEGSGKSVAVSDLWIAACAQRHSLRLVTNNRRHYDAIPGLDIVSEAPGKRKR
jgi:tRNA(fMet)-specific endonuclease VapC